jgi:aminopeptidase YwaD
VRTFTVLAGAALLASAPAQAQEVTLLPAAVIAALDQELSGETAMRNLEAVALHHRMRGSRGFRAAAEHVAARLREAGIDDVRIEEFPADGTVFYGTQRSRPAWNVDFAELWELRDAGAGWTRHRRIASWDAMPVSLAQDSESGRATAALVDVGAGTSEADYAGKQVRGRLVLTSSQPGAVAPLAVGRHGAAGIVSYAQNQRTAWWGEDENLVRWGHLDTFSPHRTFAFMVSLKQARDFRERLARGDEVRLEAEVRAGQQPGSYDVVTAAIPGADPRLREEEIAFLCHLDHQRPGANDNASGCAAILEVARTVSKLVAEGRIPPPARTLRFIWPPEIEGTLALLVARPELAERIRAVVHMDMVGGGTETKAIFHVTRGPASLPSFVYDVGEAFGAFANAQSARFAMTGAAPYPLAAPEGGKEALRAAMVPFTMGSDHQVFTDGSFRVPAIYLNDWPDRYIHTNFDRPDNVDPTKLKRAAFIGAASGYFLANLGPPDAAPLLELVQAQALRRTAAVRERMAALPPGEVANLARFHAWYEGEVVGSLEEWIPLPASARAFVAALDALTGTHPPATAPAADGRLVFHRDPALRGPMSVFGYDYLLDHYGPERAAALRLPRYAGLRGGGGEYAYEVLNFVDGRRTAQEIRDAVSAVYGPVPLDAVVEYLHALAEIGVLRRRAAAD